ncbi:MAG: L,D-transpeptidase family protein [Lachnospiraceae bacterium]|nr:L,D-transpeptidase family protein [Lachnospiraceae bacterium]
MEQTSVNHNTEQTFSRERPLDLAALQQYRNDPSVPLLLTVEYCGGSDAVVRMYEKQTSASDTAEAAWNCLLTCPAYVGRDGVGKASEGDMRTPVGDYRLEYPFGILPDPGCAVPYRQIEDHLYWCADRPWYNKLISIRKHPHRCTGEHLIKYSPQYHYSLFIGYNKAGVFGAGSAIFLHCFGPKQYTGGCVAVSEENMKEILLHFRKGTRIVIHNS